MTEHDEYDYTYQKKITCPYCLHEREGDCDDYGEQDSDIQEECQECGKAFIYTTDYDVTFCSRRVPCLNGGTCEWRTSYESNLGHKIETCRMCGKEQRFLNGERV